MKHQNKKTFGYFENKYWETETLEQQNIVIFDAIEIGKIGY